MSGLYKNLLSICRGPYQKFLGQRLRNYGLKYDDILIETPDVLKALSRIDPAERINRERRITRAFDLSTKRKFLVPEVAANYDPFDHYLGENLKIAQHEMAEKVYLRE